MRYRGSAVFSSLLIVALPVLPVVNPGVAGAQTSCDLGFALTSGGVAEADLNGDGLTCEFNTVDSVTGVWATIAVDNPPLMQGSGGFCPPGFIPTNWPQGLTPDRNSDLCICIKGDLKRKGAHVAMIDNNASSNAGGFTCFIK